jgi:hypothetical protein
MLSTIVEDILPASYYSSTLLGKSSYRTWVLLLLRCSFPCSNMTGVQNETAEHVLQGYKQISAYWGPWSATTFQMWMWRSKSMILSSVWSLCIGSSHYLHLLFTWKYCCEYGIFSSLMVPLYSSRLRSAC